MASDPAAPAVPAPRVDRVPPHSEEAERGVLGSILLDGARVIDLCVQMQIEPGSFYAPAHRALFETMLALVGDGQPVDPITIGERLRMAGRLEAVGGAVFLDHLVDGTPTAAHAEYYADIVRQKHLLRCVIECAREAERRCFSSSDSADQILSVVEQNFLSIAENQHGQMPAWDKTVHDTMDQIHRLFDLQGAGGLRGIPTGLRNLDHVIQGLRPTEMVVLAARPSMGKTSLAMNIAENIALGDVSDHQPRAVGIFSLEMSAESLAMRMLCSRARVGVAEVSGGFAPASAHAALMQAAGVLRHAPICLDDTGGLDIMELRARARRMHQKHGIQLIVVDYLQLLRSRETARQGKQQEIADVSNNLKAMAKELKVPVLVLSQLNRSPEQRSEGAPKLSDLRDSGAIEQDADVVCLLRRPSKYVERGSNDTDHQDKSLAIVDVAKQRNGPTGEVRLNFEDTLTRFTDRAAVDDPGAGGAGT